MCKFEIKIKLKPGVHWRILHAKTSSKYHNHIQLERKEMSHKCKHLSHEQKEMSILARKHGSYGVARSIISNLSGFTMSNNQIRAIKNNVDDGTTKDASQATKLMEFLRIESSIQKIRYIAIYHEVDESSLVSVSKAMVKKEIVDKLDDPDDIIKKKPIK